MLYRRFGCIGGLFWTFGWGKSKSWPNSGIAENFWTILPIYKIQYCPGAHLMYVRKLLLVRKDDGIKYVCSFDLPNIICAILIQRLLDPSFLYKSVLEIVDCKILWFFRKVVVLRKNQIRGISTIFDALICLQRNWLNNAIMQRFLNSGWCLCVDLCHLPTHHPYFSPPPPLLTGCCLASGQDVLSRAESFRKMGYVRRFEECATWVVSKNVPPGSLG